MNTPARHRISPAGLGLALLALGYALWTLAPMLWVLMSSFKTDAAILRDPLAPPAWAELDTSAYARAWGDGGLGGQFLNSVFVTIAAVSLILALGAPAAYALARFRLPGGPAAHGLFLAGLTLPAQLAVVPLFFELRAFGLLNHPIGLVLVYAANGLPFAIFVLGGFFRSVPRALHEAAVVDGCSEARAFWHVMLPLARPGLATVAIFQAIGVWKEYFHAFMLVGGSDGAARTLPLGLANLAITAQYGGDSARLFAGLTLVALPVLAVYLLLQRRLVEGVAAGAVKG